MEPTDYISMSENHEFSTNLQMSVRLYLSAVTLGLVVIAMQGFTTQGYNLGTMEADDSQ